MNNSQSEANNPPQYVDHVLGRNRKNIAEAASRRNTMVILPTALGKTVISLLVTVDILYNYRDGRILVMAPTRPLVSQHMKSFSSVLKLLEEQIAAVTGKTPPEARSAA